MPGELHAMESNLMALRTELCTRPVNFVEGIISLMNTIRPPRSTAASHASTRWPGQSKRKQDTSGPRKVDTPEQFISSFGWKQDNLIILLHVHIAGKG